MSVELKGLDEVLANLHAEISHIQGATLAGIKEAVVYIQGAAVEITPMRLSPLRQSAFTDSEMQGDTAVGRVGYTAEYAPFVHEMPDPYIPKAELVGPSIPRGYNFVGPKRQATFFCLRGRHVF